MPKLFDTHLHFDAEDDTSQILNNARQQSVSHFMIAVSTLTESKHAIQVAEQEKDTYAMVGIHPHHAHELNNIAEFETLTTHSKCLAIGEVGLDYYYNLSPRDTQKDTFQQFIKLAAKTKLPLVIHCRDAWQDCFQLLQNTLQPKQPFLIHSFTGTPEQAKQLLQMGAYISFNGMLTFKKSDNIRQNLDIIPIDKILLETDSPYLAPVPKRGKKNCPANIKYIAQYMADYLKMDYQQLAKITTENAKKFFTIK